MKTKKNVFGLSILLFCMLSVLIIPYTYAQDELFEESNKLDTVIEDELKWLQEESQEFVTVATKTKMKAQEAPSIVTVITDKQIRNMGARNIIDVLRTVPGFDLAHMGMFPLHLTYVRGMTSETTERLKVMIDGHSIQPFWGDSELHFDRLPMNSIKKIEIIRGPGSALYGTNAFIGVINIITKKGGDEPSTIAFEGGSYDSSRSWAELSVETDGVKTYISAEHSRTNGYDGTIESDMASVLPGFLPSESREMTSSSEHSTVQSNISYKNVYFSGLFQKTDTEVPIGIYSVLTDEDEMQSYYAYGELGYKSSITDNSKLMMRTYYDYSAKKIFYENYPEETSALHIGFPDSEGIHNGPSGKWYVAGLELNGDYEPWSGLQMVAGASYEYLRQFDIKTHANSNTTGSVLEVDGIEYPPFPYQYFPGGKTDISENGNWNRNADRTVTAFYAQGTFDLKEILSLEKGTETLNFTLGARYDNYNDVGSSTNPRFGIVYAPSEKLWFKALYGTAFRAPNFLNLYMQGGLYKGNPDLKPEKIATSEFLIGYKFSNMLSTSITGFYISIDDAIQIVPLEFGYEYENAGKMNSYGMEAEFKAAFGKNKYAYLNLTWQNVKDTSNKQIISQGGKIYTQDDFGPGNIPVFYGNIGINYGFTENIIANISLNYVGERERSEEKMWFGEFLVDMDARDPVDDRWLVNASFTFKNLMAEGLNFQISGFNLLDQDHNDPDIYGFVGKDIPRPGVTYSGRISYLF